MKTIEAKCERCGSIKLVKVSEDIFQFITEDLHTNNNKPTVFCYGLLKWKEEPKQIEKVKDNFIPSYELIPKPFPS